MVIRQKTLFTTDRMKEVVQSHAQDFPYAAMDVDLEALAGKCAQWHWHEHFEVGIVEKGCLQLCLQRGNISLNEGDGYFINSNVLHMCKKARDAAHVRLHTQLFDRSMISEAGLIGRKYMQPVINCVNLDVLPLYANSAEHADLLQKIRETFACAEAEGDAYELRLCARLHGVWAELYRLTAPELHGSDAAVRESTQRIKKMLTFLHEKYAQAIQVKHIAAAADVCERECYRYFARELNTTPMDYLIRYRIAAASRQLRETADDIAKIAENCGFSSANYFSKVFRQIVGCSPSAYRNGDCGSNK